MKNWEAGWAISCFILALGASACSDKPAEKAAPKPAAAAKPGAAAPAAPQPAAPAPRAAAPVAQPAAAAGNPATEKHILLLHNFAKTPVIVTLNGEWVGQWDATNESPLSAVQKGKNDLLVEVAGEAAAQITLYIQAVRDNQRVTLMTLNFQGKPGKHTFSFGAK